MDRLKLIIKSRRIYFPTLRLPIVGAGVTFPFDFSIRLPSLEGLDLGSRTKSIVAMSLVVSGLVIAGAIYFAIRGLDPVPVWPDAALYDATRAQRLGQEQIRVGEDIPEDIQEGTMTLQLNIGGARIESIKFSDMSIGAAGLTDAINISSSGGNILCEKLEFIDVEAPDFTMATSTAWSLRVATTTADGLSINPTLSSQPIKYTFGSTRGSLNVPDVSGGTFDRILISSNATSTVGLISFERVKAFGAGITISGLNCGEVVIEGSSLDNSVYGDGTGIDAASFKIGGSGIGTVKVSSSTLIGNVERPVSVK